MIDQLWSDPASSGSPPPGYSSGYLPSYPQYPESGSYLDPAALWGRYPVTGQLFSDKSKTVAGLVSLLDLIGILAIGSIYLGYIGLGIVQVLLDIFTFGLGAVIWGIVDALLILTYKVRDLSDRLLRYGT
ncbi:hypothetical protein [Mycobacterium lepromatosis]|uniref:hypothetical protein n=1 Tax=Mycobacterium lepromatosis TaxID=480418 RepID=UPI003D03C19B